MLLWTSIISTLLVAFSNTKIYCIVAASWLGTLIILDFKPGPSAFHVGGSSA